MSTTSPKLITVIGATGAQGGSLIEALLEDRSYTVRGMTRNPDSQTAIKLKEKGDHQLFSVYFIKELIYIRVKSCFLNNHHRRSYQSNKKFSVLNEYLINI